MSEVPDTEIVGNITFELRPHHRTPSHPEWVCVRKNRKFVNRYLALEKEFRNCRMVEVGVDQGGGTSFFTKLLQPEALLAIELSNQPVISVAKFLADEDPEHRVSIHWGVDQSDRLKVPDLVSATFGDQSLDLVIDDASHVLTPTIATFEMLFPKLRPGGLFIIEDWSCKHLQEKDLDALIAADPKGKADQKLNAAITSAVGTKFEMPLSLLICQLVIAAGRNPEWITEVRATDGFCEIRRGTADIAPGTPISKYIGLLGGKMLGLNPE